MAQDVEIRHADWLGVPAASFLRESADCISRQAAEIERWKGQAARNAQTCFRYKIALMLARKFGIESRGFDGGVSVMLADWLDHQPHLGVPWPSSVFAQQWLAAEGYSEVDGKIGIRATVTLPGPEQIN